MPPSPSIQKRPYDDFIPGNILARVLERRRCPDGLEVPVTQTNRAGRLVNVYPWGKLELGDYFFVSLRGHSERAMRVGLHQAATRLDYEIAIAPAEYNGFPHLRVTLVIIGKLRYMRAADEAGVKGIRFGNPDYKARNRDRYQKRRIKGGWVPSE